MERIDWMRDWADKNGVTLGLPTEAGLMREVVGVTYNGVFVTYEDGEIWEPKDSYQKKAMLAVYVLEEQESAEIQLYEWLRWIEDNGFIVECGEIEGGKELQEEMLRDCGFSLSSMRYYAKLIRRGN